MYSGNLLIPALIVLGRPPAGTKASALTRKCMVLRRTTPSSVDADRHTPWGLSLPGEKELMGRLS